MDLGFRDDGFGFRIRPGSLGGRPIPGLFEEGAGFFFFLQDAIHDVKHTLAFGRPDVRRARGTRRSNRASGGSEAEGYTSVEKMYIPPVIRVFTRRVFGGYPFPGGDP